MSFVRLRIAAIQCSLGPALVRTAISFQMTMAWSCIAAIVWVIGGEARS